MEQRLPSQRLPLVLEKLKQYRTVYPSAKLRPYVQDALVKRAVECGDFEMWLAEFLWFP